jgi:tetratricopeptide (TPR) repeat protein
MKSEHRHELKTNELADWLSHLPEWSKEHRNTLFGAAALIVVAAALLYWNAYNKRIAIPQQHLRLTTLISRVEADKMAVVRSAMEGGQDMSSSLTQPALDLGAFARDAGNKTMAATAYLQQAKAIRAEIHLRPTAMTDAEMQQQVKLAQTSYQQAKERAGADRSLLAAAEYGLGLCAEELGDFEEARQIYTRMVNNNDLRGTAPQAAAEYRLSILPDIQGSITFQPAPPTPEPPAVPVAVEPQSPAPDLVNDALAPILEMGTDANGSAN